MLAQTPPMGWNSWNTFGHEINAQVVMETADAFVSTGLGRQGYHVGMVFHSRQAADVWAKPLADGSIAVGLFSLGEREQRRVMVAWESIGLHDRRTCRVRDLWTGEDLGLHRGDFSSLVGSHDVTLIQLIPQPSG